jgi:hypothetical protein
MKPDLSKLVCVYDAGKSVVHRGARTDDGRPVLLKSLRQTFPSKASLAELRHEHRILGMLGELCIRSVLPALGLHEHDWPATAGHRGRRRRQPEDFACRGPLGQAGFSRASDRDHRRAR